MQELVVYIARALVDQPELVTLSASESDGTQVFELKVAPDDIGKIIGRDGRTVNAIRSLLTLAAQKKGAKARLEIVDDRRPGATASAAAAPGTDAPTVET